MFRLHQTNLKHSTGISLVTFICLSNSSSRYMIVFDTASLAIHDGCVAFEHRSLKWMLDREPTTLIEVATGAHTLQKAADIVSLPEMLHLYMTCSLPGVFFRVSPRGCRTLVTSFISWSFPELSRCHGLPSSGVKRLDKTAGGSVGIKFPSRRL